ncbi:hypothetical protein [Clostridium chrysemydis]|uniref:hypothetical protein n=1 Tax=Clostridium chrysemydis TaxID=2665504 RepID=UPI001883DAD2|nr:hypothetical protein [Clostridium chrysemydis]
MNYSKLIKSLELIKENLSSSKSRVLFNVDVPATKAEIEETEREVGKNCLEA